MKFDLNVEVNVDDQQVVEGLKDSLREIVYMMENVAVRLVPVDTGRLKGSIHVDRVNDYKYILADAVNYGAAVEYGTAPHVITPDEAEALKFEGDEGTVFTKKVEHPGTSAQPFMRPALEIGKIHAPRVIEKNI